MQSLLSSSWRLWLVLSLSVAGACGSSVQESAWQGASGAGGQGLAGAGGSAGSVAGSSGAGYAGGGASGSISSGGKGGNAGSAQAGSAGAGGQSSQPDPYDPAPQPVAIPQASLDLMKSRIEAALASSSAPPSTRAVLVVDEETGKELYSKHPDLPLVPASNTKLFTTSAAFGRLGPDAAFSTEVLAESNVGPSGAVSGDLHFIVHHDFSWSSYFYDDPRFPLRQLARELYDLGLRSVQGNVVLQGDAVYEAERFGTLDPASARVTAAQRLRSALTAEGISSSGAKASGSFVPPAGAVPVLSWSSMPLSVTCYPLNDVSHNEFADMLSLHLGFELGGASTYAAGTSQALDWLGSLGIDATGAELHDGSGLSHSNHVTVRQIVGLLRAMDSKEQGHAWEKTFSVAGVHGTLGGRMKGQDTLGRFFGKTGTLNGVIATSGFLEHRYLGRRFLFGMLLNGVTDKTAARRALDKVIEAVAADPLGQGPAPASPVLQKVLNDGNSSTITVSWLPVDGAEGYLVWLSHDGRVWSRDDVHYVETTTQHVVGNLSSGDRLYVRVSARMPDGRESAPSDVYGVRVSSKPSSVLVVDGYDRWQSQPVPENTLAGSHDFLVDTEHALGVVGYDTVANEVVVAGDVDLQAYRAVVWSLGEEGTADRTLTHEEQAKLEGFLNGGGGLFLSGSEVGYDLAGGDDAQDKAFYEDTLKAKYVADDAGTFVVRGVGGVFQNIHRLRFYTPAEMVVNYPDKISAAGASQVVLEYATGGAAAIQYQANYRLVYMAFPFESIDNAKDREKVMGDVMAFLLK